MTGIGLQQILEVVFWIVQSPIPLQIRVWEQKHNVPSFCSHWREGKFRENSTNKEAGLNTLQDRWAGTKSHLSLSTVQNERNGPAIASPQPDPEGGHT